MKSSAREFLKEWHSLGVFPRGVAMDSRKVKEGDIFLAFADSIADRRLFIRNAVQAGAVMIVAEKEGLSSTDFEKKFGFTVENAPVPLIFKENLRQWAGFLSAAVWEYPSEKLHLLAITGTNGKTTISHALGQVYPQPCVLIGTLGAGFLGNLNETGFTTPEAPDLMRLLHDFLNAGARAVALEASSIGIAEGRLNGARVEAAIFTNLTRDHLDYHKTMEDYAAAKMQLFKTPQLRLAVVNGDDDFGKIILKESTAHRVLSYGLGEGKNISAQNLKVDGENALQTFDLILPTGRVGVKTSLLGKHNVYNLLAVAAILWDGGRSPQEIGDALNLIQAPEGRLERVFLPDAPLVLVDFAHTPDALENALSSLIFLKEKRLGKLWVVFGCGGNRDAGKRSQMGKIASLMADCVVVTSDNPRDEAPLKIIEAILEDAGKDAVVLPERDVAIDYAIQHAHQNDVILIAGKGHENYQEIEGVKTPFLDKTHAQNALKKHWGQE